MSGAHQQQEGTMGDVHEHNTNAVRMRLAAQYNAQPADTTPTRSEVKFTLTADGEAMPVVLVQDTNLKHATLCEVCCVWVTTYITDDPDSDMTGEMGGSIATCMPCTVTAPHFDGLTPRQ